MKNVEWNKVLLNIVEWAEENYQLTLFIDAEVVEEISIRVRKSAADLNIAKPNVAKIAGLVTFWIRKLKPIWHHPESNKKILTINEKIAFLVGLSICRKYSDDTSRIAPYPYNDRIFSDWIASLRYNSHSPHSSMISFELIGTHPES